ncbi:MAG: serine protease, partial [Bacteroidaceae bacterium]|nr:serine protease [Bacteroidaceae bacterium]
RAIGADKMGDRFFYLRELAELEARMYQQALDDIRSAITLNPSEMLYRIEEALILLRAGLFDEAIKAAQNTLTLLPENPDCYKIIGIAHGELGHKAQAVQALSKAIELGDETAQPFLQKYQ